MGNKKTIVVTSYGHDKTIDKIAVGTFESSDEFSESGYYDVQKSDAKKYCDTINSLELKGDNWVFAKQVSENVQYELGELLLLKFSDIIIKLDDRAIQKILREVDSRKIAEALHGENEIIKNKIFNNMSKRAAGMLKEDMDLRPLRLPSAVKEAKKMILCIIRKLEDAGEIVINLSKKES